MDLRGERFLVEDVEHGLCSCCGEVLLDLDAIDYVQRDAIRQAREARGLLAPDEIRDIRRKLGLSQAALEDVLGVGPKTVIRWEKGTVFQSATADRLMRLLDGHAELLPILRSGELYPRVPTRRAG
jgi:HTH-type transcriptional regulator/antitoxin MqsA